MQRGGAGARALNVLLQQPINPPTEQAIERFGQRYGPGDKVMRIVNDRGRDIYNGDLGVITRVDHEEGELWARFGETDAMFDFGGSTPSSSPMRPPFTRLGIRNTRWSWSRSPPKFIMLGRELVHTAVTRAKRLVVLVGSRRALAIAVKRRRPRRWSLLRERLSRG